MKLKQGDLLRQIVNSDCPFCERVKLVGAMFCDECYKKLPLETQSQIKRGLKLLSDAIKAGIIFLEDAR
jgi:hypothetical protein